MSKRTSNVFFHNCELSASVERSWCFGSCRDGSESRPLYWWREILGSWVLSMQHGRSSRIASSSCSSSAVPRSSVILGKGKTRLNVSKPCTCFSGAKTPCS